MPGRVTSKWYRGPRKTPAELARLRGDSGKQRRKFREERSLRLVHRTFGVIAADKMRHNEAQLEGGECSALLRKLPRLMRL